jgi:hypothetical protein
MTVSAEGSFCFREGIMKGGYLKMPIRGPRQHYSSVDTFISYPKTRANLSWDTAGLVFLIFIKGREKLSKPKL